jgi:D-alanine-D-alanine ligase-like ATP-grasp enzyme
MPSSRPSYTSLVRKLMRTVARSYRRYQYYKGFWNPELSDFEIRLSHGLWKQSAEQCGLKAHQEGPLLVITDADQNVVMSVHEHAVSFESLTAFFVCGDKVLTNSMLQKAGIRVPEGACFASGQVDDGVTYALGLQRPCVVKPARNTGASFGVSVNLTSEQQIRSAFTEAALFCEDVLIEEFVPGDPYRFLVYKGKCLSATRREVAGVVGNGQDSIKVLVDRKNQGRLTTFSWSPGNSPLMAMPADERATAVLARSGLNWDSVPAAGTFVQTFDKSEYHFGATYHEVLGDTHPDTVVDIEKAATIVGANLAGVDVLSTDLRAGAYAINEVNTTPGIWLHYCVGEGARDPLSTILAGEALRHTAARA